MRCLPSCLSLQTSLGLLLCRADIMSMRMLKIQMEHAALHTLLTYVLAWLLMLLMYKLLGLWYPSNVQLFLLSGFLISGHLLGLHIFMIPSSFKIQF